MNASASACGMIFLLAIAAALPFGTNVGKLRVNDTFLADPDIVWLEASVYPYAPAACRLSRGETRASAHGEGAKPAIEAPAARDRWCPHPPLQ